MLITKAAFVLLFLFSSAMSYGQHSIKGRVIDAFSMEPIQGASLIFNSDDELMVVSDADGRFKIDSDKTLTSLNCKYAGYKPFTMKLKKRRTSILVELVASEDESTETDTISSPTQMPHTGH